MNLMCVKNLAYNKLGRQKIIVFSLQFWFPLFKLIVIIMIIANIVIIIIIIVICIVIIIFIVTFIVIVIACIVIIVITIIVFIIINVINFILFHFIFFCCSSYLFLSACVTCMYTFFFLLFFYLFLKTSSLNISELNFIFALIIQHHFLSLWFIPSSSSSFSFHSYQLY